MISPRNAVVTLIHRSASHLSHISARKRDLDVDDHNPSRKRVNAEKYSNSLDGVQESLDRLKDQIAVFFYLLRSPPIWIRNTPIGSTIMREIMSISAKSTYSS